MTRFLLASLAALAVCALAPLTASASILEVGQTTSPLVAPVCPSGVSQADCTIVLTQATALETLRDGVTNPTTITKPGEVVSFSLGISALSSTAATVNSDISYLDGAYGGPAEAAITVLRIVGKKSLKRYVVAAESPDFQLEPYLGQVVQFPLFQPLPVVPGEVLALTVPTWAPVLSYELTTSQFAYRSSRHTSCAKPVTPAAETVIGGSTLYGCSYTGTRVEYSATEITTPAPN